MLNPPFSIRLREGTRESHRLAETTPFIRAFFKGELSLDSYRLFLMQLLHIYAALEEGQEAHREHVLFSKVYFPQLNRRAALITDLGHYFSNESWQTITPLETTQAYAAHIRRLWQDDPARLVAHHYTRYLGDLSGGQAMKRIVMKMFPANNGAGLAFYEFPEIADHNAFKEEYRARLDAMPLDDATAQRIVDEANFAFALNRQVFASMMETIIA